MTGKNNGPWWVEINHAKPSPRTGRARELAGPYGTKGMAEEVRRDALITGAVSAFVRNNEPGRKSNPTGLYVVNVYDANGHFTGDKFLVRTLKDAVGETAARIGEGGFGFTADGYFIFPPFGHVKAKGNDGAADFRKYRMAAAGKKNAGTARARGAKSKLQKMGERMGRYGKRGENPSVPKKGTLYTDHRGLAFYLIPRGRDTWQVMGAAGLGSRVQEENLGTVERRGDGLLYVLLPAVGQWWKPTGKTTRAAANYILEQSGDILGRRSNPDIHIDIGSHNTRGRNVRAKNPASKEAAALLDWWEKHVGHREMPGFPNVAAMRRAKREYMAEAGLSKPGRGKNPARKNHVPPLKDWDITSGGTGISENRKSHHWRAENYGTGPSGFREYSIQPIARNGRHAGYQLRVWDAKAGGYTVLGTYSSARDAHTRVREIEARQFGKGADPDRERRSNPATVHSHNKGRERVILVLKGHPKGTGYWTGEGWDTVKAKARIITATNLADVVKMAEKLAKGMPASYRIEVHASGK